MAHQRFWQQSIRISNEIAKNIEFKLTDEFGRLEFGGVQNSENCVTLSANLTSNKEAMALFREVEQRPGEGSTIHCTLIGCSGNPKWHYWPKRPPIGLRFEITTVKTKASRGKLTLLSKCHNI